MRKFYARATLQPMSPTADPSRVDTALVWLRRDLRVDDHAALYHALRAARRVCCVFVFDTAILDTLAGDHGGAPGAGLKADRRVEFIRASLVGVDAGLRALAAAHGVEGAGLLVAHGAAAEVLPALAEALHAQAVYASHDDDPYALARDAQVRGRLAQRGVALHTGKDHVVFERAEVLTRAGGAYTVFTPYKTAWLARLQPYYLRAYPVGKHAAALAPRPAEPPALPVGRCWAGVPTLAEIGFAPSDLHRLPLPSGAAGAEELLADFLAGRIDHYHERRELPAVKGPSYLGVHLRFGTVSVRRLACEAWQRAQAGSRGAEVWLSELIWRDFYHQLLHHHPQVAGHAFRPEYERIRWEHGRQADAHFAAWCEGRTGYPLVDAAMRQLVQTGYMHNRLRMLSASFLTKDLGIDWRRGEAWFARHLNDYDLAANNGGWQWAASTGCDAQPYFRIFNPLTQSRRFDADGRFIRRYLPALARLPDAAIHAPWLARAADLAAAGVVLGRDYPLPIVDHAEARARTLQRYAAVRPSG
jgi:deoxyribodipyrimidine photo-lyase